VEERHRSGNIEDMEPCDGMTKMIFRDIMITHLFYTLMLAGIHLQLATLEAMCDG
jgi:hypothetical protein